MLPSYGEVLRVNIHNFGSLYPENKIKKIIHELGHVVGNNSGQKMSITDCLNKKDSFVDRDMVLGQACYPAYSIYAKYAKEFCTDDLTKNKHIKKHVSLYATTRCNDDFAESFAHYVLDTDLSNKKDLARAKTGYFELEMKLEKSDLKNIKQEIRDKISTSEFCNEIK
jgi:hypothetical protein